MLVQCISSCIDMRDKLLSTENVIIVYLFFLVRSDCRNFLLQAFGTIKITLYLYNAVMFYGCAKKACCCCCCCCFYLFLEVAIYKKHSLPLSKENFLGSRFRCFSHHLVDSSPRFFSFCCKLLSQVSFKCME